jgi:hypothetical protein
MRMCAHPELKDELDELSNRALTAEHVVNSRRSFLFVCSLLFVALFCLFVFVFRFPFPLVLRRKHYSISRGEIGRYNLQGGYLINVIRRILI